MTTIQAKVVVHVNPNGADPIPFGIGGPPYAVIQVIPMAGDLSRFKVSSSDTTDEDEDDIVQTERVPSRIVQTSESWNRTHPRRSSTLLQFTSLDSTSSRVIRTRDHLHLPGRTSRRSLGLMLSRAGLMVALDPPWGTSSEVRLIVTGEQSQQQAGPRCTLKRRAPGTA